MIWRRGRVIDRPSRPPREVWRIMQSVPTLISVFERLNRQYTPKKRPIRVMPALNFTDMSTNRPNRHKCGLAVGE